MIFKINKHGGYDAYLTGRLYKENKMIRDYLTELAGVSLKFRETEEKWQFSLIRGSVGHNIRVKGYPIPSNTNLYTSVPIETASRVKDLLYSAPGFKALKSSDNRFKISERIAGFIVYYNKRLLDICNQCTYRGVPESSFKDELKEAIMIYHRDILGNKLKVTEDFIQRNLDKL